MCWQLTLIHIYLYVINTLNATQRKNYIRVEKVAKWRDKEWGILKQVLIMCYYYVFTCTHKMCGRAWKRLIVSCIELVQNVRDIFNGTL